MYKHNFKPKTYVYKDDYFYFQVNWKDSTAQRPVGSELWWVNGRGELKDLSLSPYIVIESYGSIPAHMIDMYLH